MNRRSASLGLIASCALLALGPRADGEDVIVSAPFPMPAITVPEFPARDFAVADYGAQEGGTVAITDAIRRAIAACHAAGGGRVVIPRGRWLTGAIPLASRVNLHLAEGTLLEFSDDPQDYLPAVRTSWEGMECSNCSRLIYAADCDDVALTGPGTIEARMETWTVWFARPPAHLAALKQLYEMMSHDVPVEARQMAVGENHLRPQFVQFNRCRRVLIEDVKIRHGPFWTIHLFQCDGAVVRRVDISAHGHNNDGIDPETTRNLLVEDCGFDQGDDAIAIKAGSATSTCTTAPLRIPPTIRRSTFSSSRPTAGAAASSRTSPSKTSPRAARASACSGSRPTCFINGATLSRPTRSVLRRSAA